MKVALVIGSANCVWSDYDRALELWEAVERPNAYVDDFDYWDTFVINDTIPVFPDWIDHAVTLHPPKLVQWARDRNVKGGNVPPQVWAHRIDMPHNDLVTNISSDWGGSSGLFACKIAIELGYKKIILCGVPMDAEQQHIVRKTNWTASSAFRRGWQSHICQIEGLVKSFSGWTKEQLGEPTIDWLVQTKPGNNAAA